MKIKSLTLAALTAFAIGSAQAAIGQANTWTLNDVTFNDGATAYGTFSVDASANLTYFDITTTTTSTFAGSNYYYNNGGVNYNYNYSMNNYIDIFYNNSLNELYITF